MELTMQKVALAASLGDGSENADYHYNKSACVKLIKLVSPLQWEDELFGNRSLYRLSPIIVSSM